MDRQWNRTIEPKKAIVPRSSRPFLKAWRQRHVARRADHGANAEHGAPRPGQGGVGKDPHQRFTCPKHPGARQQLELRPQRENERGRQVGCCDAVDASRSGLDLDRCRTLPLEEVEFATIVGGRWFREESDAVPIPRFAKPPETASDEPQAGHWLDRKSTRLN